MAAQLFRPSGTLSDGADPVLITPATAGWRYAGLRIIQIGPGATRGIGFDGVEGGVLPLSGSCRVAIDGVTHDVAGRASVFEGVADFLFIPLGSYFEVTSAAGCEIAIPTAVATRRTEVSHVAAADVAIEIRGAGQATRQINNFASAATFVGADKLIAVEVLTPAGNWSSFPPHKHDEHTDAEVPLEEIYYFKIDDRQGGEGFGFHRTYTTDNEIDATVTVRDGDVFLIPRGYHGPCVAAPGHHMYYLNVMAGPLPERAWLVCDDPAHAWVKTTWNAESPDPRLPLYGTAVG